MNEGKQIVSTDFVVNEEERGTFVIIKKSWVDDVMKDPRVVTAGGSREKMIVSLACTAAGYHQDQALSYMSDPNFREIQEIENARALFKGDVGTEWEVPAYFVFLPHLE